jgi:hypothetical protein
MMLVELIGVLIIIVGSVMLLSMAWDARQRARKTSQEKEVFRLAQQAGGRLTVADVVAATSLTSDEADGMLEEMVKKGHATIRVTESGGIVYDGTSMLPATSAADDVPNDTPARPAPSQNAEPENPLATPFDAPVETLKTGLDGIASQFPQTLAASGFLSERLNVLSSAYKNWLPKLVDRLDELAAESDEAALHAFKPVLSEELAKYREHQLNSQFPNGEETDTQFQARMILKFSSGPMITVLESALREILYWKAHDDTVDAAVVVRKLKALLTEAAL